MTAISLNATVVTKDYNLSDLSKQQESTTWSSNTVTVTSGWDGVAHDYGEYPYDAEDYTEIVLELSSAASVGVYFEIKYADNSTASKTIEAGSLVARIALTSASIKRIDVKLTAAGSATISKLYFSKVIGKETPTNLFIGTKTFNWNWEDRILIPNTAFASIHEGDRIQFAYTSGASGQCQVRVQNLDDATNQLTETGEYATITQSQAESATFSFVLRAEDIEKIQANGLYFHGNDYTITSVDLLTYAQQFMAETEMAHGAETLNWGETWKQTVLPTLTEGDELRVIVSAVDGSNNYQINFKYGWEDGQQIAVVGIDATVPKLYSVALTDEQAAAINAAGQLFMYGTGVTLARFAIAQPMSIYDERIVSSEEIVVNDGWSGSATIEAAKLTNLKAGNIICVQLRALGENNGASDDEDQVLLKYGDSWADFAPAANYLFQANHALAPMTVEIPVTAKMRDQMRGQKLVVTGKDYTMTHVFIKEGIPVNTNSKFLSVSDAGMATLVVPFNVPTLPEGVEAYELTNNGDATIWANPVDALEADKPVLIVAAAGEYEFRSEDGASDDISGKTGTYTNGALIGTYQTIDPLEQTTGGNFNYVLNNQGGNVAFYQVKDATCSVAPYRAYLNCAHDASNGGANFAPKMRIVFHKDATTGIESQELKINSQKLIRNGQVIIIRDNKEFNVFGQQL